MSEKFQIAIIGAGPGGLSAATRAAQQGLSHVLLEASAQLANTVAHYQKGKWVMDEPAILPLRSPLHFQADSRENLLLLWEECLRNHAVNIRYQSRVTAISGERGAFCIALDTGESVLADTVVLAIGMQGNLRRLPEKICAPDLAFVQYQLDDADDFQDETIVVIGAGDAAIENALALAEHNQVVLVNRRDEFPRAKPANSVALQKAIKNDKLDYYASTIPVSVQALSEATDKGKVGVIELKTPEGPTHIACHRIIARLGAVPPRDFVESCGVKFPHADADSVPALSSQYESNVPGLYIIGALAGYPLIKQAINQGFEVVEFIRGNAVQPADEPLLHDKFRHLPAFHSVHATLEMIQLNMPLLSGLTNLQLRQFILESDVRLPEPGEVIFRYNDYTNSFFSIISGEVRIPIDRKDPNRIITLRQGQFFGEMGLISGRRRTATVYAGAGQQCVLIETPRLTMLKLINSVPAVRRIIDEIFMLRTIQSSIAPEIPATDLAAVIHSARIEQYAPGEAIFSEGDAGDCLHLIRSGSVTVSRTVGNSEVILSYVAAGNYVGEMALLSRTPRSGTVRAAVATETIRLEGTAFMALLNRSPTLRQRLEARFQKTLARQAKMENQPQAGNMISFLVSQGLGEATDVLLIDESLCIHCNNCEKACAETHGGTSRLDREAGPTFASVHVPTSCRHCEHPHCMKDCPPDAIHRAPNGEVYIADNCIGCGNCESNCPYGVIQMAGKSQKKPGLLAWLLFGFGPEPGKFRPLKEVKADKKAVKCDMCKDLDGSPSCVDACPTGAAIRVSPEKFMSLTRIKS